MYDPLNNVTHNPFAATSPLAPAWPSTPHSPGSSQAILPKPASPKPPTPEKPRAQSPRTSNPYGREPQIYGQPGPGLISPEANTDSNGANFERKEPYLRVRLTGLDRNRRDILVRLDAQTNLSNFTGTTYRNISRTYVEFQRFAEQLSYSNPQTIVPALPLPQTSAPSDEEDDRLIKISLQKWITRVCEDVVLLGDEEVRSFIESDFGYQPTVRAKRKTSSGFSLFGRGVPDEDQELMTARFELTRLEGEFFEAAKAVDKVGRARKALSVAHAEMGNKLISVATTEAHPPLGVGLRKLGRVWHTLGDIDQAQAVSETVILGDVLGYEGINARAAKETLQQRSLVLEEYQSAVKNSISKRRNIERLKASGNIRPERVDEALEDMEEANKIEQLLARKVDGISQNLHKALHTHSRHTHQEITHALIEHARTVLLYERQLLRELESLRPDFANINKKSVLTAVPAHVQSPTRTMSAQDVSMSRERASSVDSLGPANGATGSPASARMDGTKSMFINPPAQQQPQIPTSPLAAQSPNSPAAPIPSSANMREPLSNPSTNTQRFNPSLQGRPGLTNSNTMARSMFVEPQRRRLDAREAASKLANFL